LTNSKTAFFLFFNLGASRACGAGPGYPLVSFFAFGKKRITLLSLARQR
jgi:hypothetical protein